MFFAADDLIRQWLAGVESASSAATSNGSHATFAPRVAVTDNSTDFLSAVDWASGDVGQSTRDVLKGLLNTELKCEASAAKKSTGKKAYNPLVTMEMRHNEVQPTKSICFW